MKMNIIRIVTGFLLMALFIASIVIPVSMALSDSSYYADVTVTNNGTSSYDGRILLTTPAKSLVDGYFLQSDAEDISIASGYITAKDLEQTSATFTFYVGEIPKGSSKTKLYFGDPSATRNQSWICMPDDTTIAADAASLDITGDVVVSITCNVTQTPTDNQLMVSKTGNYRLSIDSVGGVPQYEYTVSQLNAAAQSVSCSPNANGMLSELSNDDYTILVDGNDGTFASTNSTTYLTSNYYIDYQSTMPDYSDINSVTVYFRMRSSSAGIQAHAKPKIFLNGVTVTGTEVTNATASFVEYHETLARPGGGTWSWEDLKDLIVGVSLNIAGSSYTSQCSELWTVINADIVDNYTATMAATIGTTQTVRGSYDSTTGLSISVDGVSSATTAATGALNTNADKLYLAQFNGKADDIYIGGTDYSAPTWITSYTFEPNEIDSDTIIDQTGSNTVTYSLYNDTDIVAVLGSILPITTTGYSATTTASIIGVIDSLPDEPDNLYTEDDVSTKFGIIGQSVNDVADSASMTPALIWSIIGTTIIVAMGIVVLMYAPSVLVAAFSQGVGLFILYVMGILTGWIALVYPFMAAGILLARRGVV